MAFGAAFLFRIAALAALSRRFALRLAPTSDRLNGDLFGLFR